MHRMRAPWTLFAHKLLLGQLARIEAAEGGALRDWPSAHGQTKVPLLTALRVMMTEIIPADPLRADYRLAAAELGGWRRASFAAGRFAILFRADPASRSILFGWISDAEVPRGVPQAGSDPAILFGTFCILTRDGRIRLPQSLREVAGLTAGARLDLLFDGMTLRIEAAPQLGSVDPVLAAAVTCLDQVAIASPAAIKKSWGSSACPPRPPVISLGEAQ